MEVWKCESVRWHWPCQDSARVSLQKGAFVSMCPCCHKGMGHVARHQFREWERICFNGWKSKATLIVPSEHKVCWPARLWCCMISQGVAAHLHKDQKWIWLIQTSPKMKGWKMNWSAHTPSQRHGEKWRIGLSTTHRSRCKQFWVQEKPQIKQQTSGKTHHRLTTWFTTWITWFTTWITWLTTWIRSGFKISCSAGKTTSVRSASTTENLRLIWIQELRCHNHQVSCSLAFK